MTDMYTVGSEGPVRFAPEDPQIDLQRGSMLLCPPLLPHGPSGEGSVGSTRQAR